MNNLPGIRAQKIVGKFRFMCAHNDQVGLEVGGKPQRFFIDAAMPDMLLELNAFCAVFLNQSCQPLLGVVKEFTLEVLWDQLHHYGHFEHAIGHNSENVKARSAVPCVVDCRGQHLVGGALIIRIYQGDYVLHGEIHLVERSEQS